MIKFCTFIFAILFVLPSQAVLSDIDWMTREELVTLFQTKQNLSIQESDVQPQDIVSSENPLCDFEVSAVVNYTNHQGGPDTDTCYVCFEHRKAAGKQTTSIYAIESHCLE